VVDPIREAVRQLRRLPGVGEKSATRLVYFLLRAEPGTARDIAAALLALDEGVRECSVCCDLTGADPCPICASATRDASTLLVVEHPQDVTAFERAAEHRGRYHVLHGAISPIDGIGPDRLKIRELLARVDEQAAEGSRIEEVIIATNPTLEGEATAMYLNERLEGHVGSVTRIARGLPVGGDLEYADDVTLIRALQGRRAL